MRLMTEEAFECLTTVVIPVETGFQFFIKVRISLDSRLRGNDGQ